MSNFSNCPCTQVWAMLYKGGGSHCETGVEQTFEHCGGY